MMAEKCRREIASGARVTSYALVNLQATPCTGCERNTVPRATCATWDNWPLPGASSAARRTMEHEGKGRR
jgi:hypothetical protein